MNSICNSNVTEHPSPSKGSTNKTEWMQLFLFLFHFFCRYLAGYFIAHVPYNLHFGDNLSLVFYYVWSDNTYLWIHEWKNCFLLAYNFVLCWTHACIATLWYFLSNKEISICFYTDEIWQLEITHLLHCFVVKE